MAPKAKGAAASEAKQLSSFDAEADKWSKLLVAASEKAPAKVAPYALKAAPVIAKIIAALIIAWPYVMKYTALAREYYAMLPHQVIVLILGAICCFFGGMFPATIAAVEAWKLCGGKEAIKDLKILMEEADKVKKASEEDDKVDADNDGVADTTQLKPADLLQHKMLLAARVSDPAHINLAIGGLYTGWVGVVAVLKIQFARTVTLGATIGDAINKPATTYIAPILTKVVGEDNEKWVPVVLNWFCRGLAISLAWWLTRVISGFHSAIRGGHIMAMALFALLSDRGIYTIDAEKSYLDEIVGWTFAVVGFFWQWQCGFSVPMLFSLFLFPVQFIESLIVWQVSY